MRPILLEFVPLVILGFAYFAIKNMDKQSGNGGWLSSVIARIKWENWILTLIIAMALALIITKAII